MAQSGRSVGELADLIDKLCAGSLPATIRGDRTRHLVGTAPLASATQEQLSFLSNSRYRSAAAAATAGALVLSPADARAIFADDIGDRTLIETKNPYAWFALAAQQLAPAAVVVPGISASADIAPSARIDRTARIEAYAVVEADAVIGAGTWIGAGSYVGRACHVGERTRLYPGVRLMEATVVGARAVIHSGAVLGADGFGFAPHEGRWLKIPQTGRVIVGDDVEIGANTTIDRGAMGDTVIEEGVKLDNQIQIGHNCRIGAHTVLAGCVGVAGSANIGRGCQIGGAAMIAGHLSIADGTIIGGGTLVSRTIREAGFYTGIYPMMTNRDWERSAAVVRNLEDLRLRLRALEKQLKGEGGDPS